MARIQVLELPEKVVGQYVETPFILVIDQVPEDEILAYDWSRERVKESLGAEGIIVTAGTLDVHVP